MAEMSRLGRWLVNRKTEGRARKVLGQLGPEFAVEPGAAVLELGSGGGGMVALLHERFHPARIVGTDYDPAQVSAATRFLTERWGEIPASIELRSADALSLPFPDASFDYVFALLMLHHVETKFSEYVRRPRVLAEIRRVLRPGGRFVYSDMFRRKEIRATLVQLEFTAQLDRSRRRTDLAVFRVGTPRAG